MQLFCTESLSTVLEQAFNSVAEQLARFALAPLSNPSLSGEIERMWSRQCPDIPHLDVGRKTGSRKIVKSYANEYGRRVARDVTTLEVTIPFSGPARGFMLIPSHCAIISENFELDHGCIRYTMPFDPSLEPQLEKLLQQIENNLATSNTEITAFSKTALSRLSAIAASRKGHLENELEVAKAFSFKVG
jgi:hypothetical protein